MQLKIREKEKLINNFIRNLSQTWIKLKFKNKTYFHRDLSTIVKALSLFAVEGVSLYGLVTLLPSCVFNVCGHVSRKGGQN